MSLTTWTLVIVLFVALRFAVRGKTLDMTWLLILWAPFNRLTFNVRNRGHRAPRTVALTNESKDRLFAYAEPSQRPALEREEARLRAAYDLDALYAHSTAPNYRENLYVLSLLEKAFEGVSSRDSALTSTFRALDVGSAIFCYATAIERFSRLRLSPAAPVSVLGIEVDGNVLYRDGTTRADHARAEAALAGENTTFEVADFIGFDRGQFSLVTLFYPFVTEGALLRWGLPRPLFRRDDFLTHAVKTVADEGFLLVVNHTHEERDIVREWMRHCGEVVQVSVGPVECELVDYSRDVEERSFSLYRKVVAPDRE